MSSLLIRIFIFYLLILLPGELFLSSSAAFPESREKNVQKDRTSSVFIEPKIVDQTPIYGYRIVNTYPHDPNSFTQGLVFVDGFLFEGTGLRGRSSLRKVDLLTGNVLQIRKLPAPFFGEGVTIFHNRVIQLTWRASLGFVYHKDTFQLLETFYYPTEGWGITNDGQWLIMSDGTPILHFLDTETYKEIGRIEVHDSKGQVSNLNELEYVQGLILANVWKTDRIAQISPDTGEVVGWIDLGGLLREEDRVQQAGVLNGIAYDQKNERLFVTGKLWPKLFEIELTVPER